MKLLTERNRTLAIAESCTGGFLAHRITNVPGASAVFLAGYVTYSNEAKAAMLGIDPRLISKHGAVSGKSHKRWRKVHAKKRTRISPWPRLASPVWRRDGRKAGRHCFHCAGRRRSPHEDRKTLFPRRPADLQGIDRADRAGNAAARNDLGVIPSEVEGSRGETLKLTIRDPSTSLGMTALFTDRRGPACRPSRANKIARRPAPAFECSHARPDSPAKCRHACRRLRPSSA